MKQVLYRVPNRLRKYRCIMGYQQKDVARLIGLRSTSIICRWERGVARPSLENLFKLSVLYKTLIDQLYVDLRLQTCKELYERNEKIKEKPT